MTGRGFIDQLSCPYCRAALVPELGDGDPILHGSARCGCYEYPIVDGILVLRQLSGPADTVDLAVVHLRAGDVDAARAHLESAASMVPQAAARAPLLSPATARRLAGSVRRRIGAAGASRAGRPEVPRDPVWAALERARPPAFAAYLYQRYANPSFIASIPMMALLEVVEGRSRPGGRPTVLDLGCGVGHSTAMMRALFPTLAFVAADPDFVNLRILREHFADDAIAVCLDAELPLPFGDDQFDAMFCLDAFHYIRSKWALSRELDRCVDDAGVWIFPHLHNALVPNISPGIPLAPDDYLRMVDFADGVLLDETVVLDRFVSDHVLDLTAPPDPRELATVADLGLYATRRSDAGRCYDVGSRMTALRRSGVLGVNPIYSIEPDGEVVHLRMAWPDAELERECAAVRRHLPETVDIPAGLLARLGDGDLDDDEERLVADLVRTLVLLPLPPGYH